MKKGSETPRYEESSQVLLSLIDHVHLCKADASLPNLR